MSAQSDFRAHRWLSKDGLSLYSRVYDAAGPAAAAVLCLPGLTRNSKDFEDLAPHLSPRYRVICPTFAAAACPRPTPFGRTTIQACISPILPAFSPGLECNALRLLAPRSAGCSRCCCRRSCRASSPAWY